MLRFESFTCLGGALLLGCSLLASPAHADAWIGKASFYILKSRTASGHPKTELAAAHRNLPFGTHIKVTNLSNDHSIIVTVNDRGPFVKGRIIDVSAKAADLLGMRSAGVARVKIETLAQPDATP
jgi:rare lipoprotein A